MKARIIFLLYGIGLLLFVGFGWSLAENPTALKGIITAVCFIALFVGAKIVNRYVAE